MVGTHLGRRCCQVAVVPDAQFFIPAPRDDVLLFGVDVEGQCWAGVEVPFSLGHRDLVRVLGVLVVGGASGGRAKVVLAERPRVVDREHSELVAGSAGGVGRILARTDGV